MARLTPYPNCSRPGAAAFAALLLAALCSPGCDMEMAAAIEAKEDEEEPTPLVRVATLELRKVRREIETTGYIESERHVTVMSKVPGRVIEVLIDEGDEVTEGQVIARIDDREAASARKQAEIRQRDAHVAAELAQIEIDAGLRREKQSLIDRDRAKAEMDRLEAQDPESVSRKALEEARFTLESAEQALAVAGFVSRKGTADLKKAHIAIEEVTARLEEADIRLQEHEIKAPFDGITVERHITGGETIGAATELFVIIDPGHLISYLSRPQHELLLLAAAREVRFVADADPDRECTADIDLVSRVVDEDTGHFKIRMRVREADTSWLRSGMFIRARIQTEDAREALMVPKAALLAEGEDSVVFAVRDGVAFKIILNPGLEEQMWVECRNRGDGGLEPGDRVITAGHEDLDEQTEVEISEG